MQSVNSSSDKRSGIAQRLAGSSWRGLTSRKPQEIDPDELEEDAQESHGKSGDFRRHHTPCFAHQSQMEEETEEEPRDGTHKTRRCCWNRRTPKSRETSCGDTSITIAPHNQPPNEGRRRRKPRSICIRFFRGLLLWFPGCRKHGNTFLSEAMLATCVRVFLSYVVVYVANKQLYHAGVDYVRSHEEDPSRVDEQINSLCLKSLDDRFDFLGYAMTGNLILALPALPIVRCRLLKENVQYENVSITFKKTFLMTLCELVQLTSIPYLITLVFLGIGFHVFVFDDCSSVLDWRLLVAYVAIQIVLIYSYLLRWYQLILFHHLHEHLCLQRGFWRDANRFVYDGHSFLDLFVCCWTRRSRDKLRIKVKLYNAAKVGQLEQLHAAVQEAQELDGINFARKWYNCGSADTRNRHSKWFFIWRQYFHRCKRNPLHVAIAFGHLEVVQYLLVEANFDVNGYERMELLRMDLSSFYHNMMQYIWLFNRTSLRKQTREIFGTWGTLVTPLHVAITMTNHDIGLFLIQMGANPDGIAHSRHWRFCTPPLFWATTDGCVELLLLQADANHLHVPGHGFYLTPYESARMQHFTCVATELELYGGDVALTPLHVACAEGDEDEVEHLLRYGADANSLGERCVGIFHRTPLHWAAMRGQHHVIPLLLDYGAYVDVVDCFRRTPLAWACLFRRLECVEALLDANADPNVKDEDGVPILCLCAASPALIQERGGLHLLAATGANDGMSSKQDPILLFFEGLLDLWKSHEGDLALACDRNGDTALHIALRHGNEQAAIALVRAGLNLTIPNNYGQRAIDCTTSTSIRYAVKKEAGYRDVMISYCHAHAQFAWKVRNALEQAYVTTWMDQMDPTGITGGSVWRQEIAQAIEHSTMMLCILCEHYPKSQWCMKELAFAKVTETPVVAITCAEVELNDEMQMYLYTRQIVDFRPAILQVHDVKNSNCHATNEAQEQQGLVTNHSSQCELLSEKSHDPNLKKATSNTSDGEGPRKCGCWFEYDNDLFDDQMKMLLDGIRDEIELQHKAKVQQKRLEESRALERSGGDGSNPRQLRRIESMLTDGTFLTVNGNDSMIGSTLVPPAVSVTDLTELTDHGRLRRHTMLPSTIGGTSSPSRNAKKLRVFIAHGECHSSFCLRLKQFLLDSAECAGSNPLRHGFGSANMLCSGGEAVGRLSRIVGSPVAESRRRSSSHSPTPSPVDLVLSPLSQNMSPLDPSRDRSRSRSRSRSPSRPAATTIRAPFANVFIDSSAAMRSSKNALVDSDVVIVVLSPKSIGSSRLADQLAFAEDHGKQIVPIVLSVFEIDAAKRYTFSRRQAMERMHHFHESIGFQQSAEDLMKTLGQCWREQQQSQMEQQQKHLREQQQQQVVGGYSSAVPSDFLSPVNIPVHDGAAVASGHDSPSTFALSPSNHHVQRPNESENTTPRDDIAVVE